VAESKIELALELGVEDGARSPFVGAPPVWNEVHSKVHTDGGSVVVDAERETPGY
jgi:hypothetical protein